MEKSGPILFDYKELMMSFAYNSSHITLQGDTISAPMIIQSHRLGHQVATGSIASFYHLIL